MAVAAAVVLAAAFLEDDDLVVAELTHDFGSHLRVVDVRGADLVAQHQYFAEHDGGAGFGFELFNGNDVVFADAILFAARLDYCEHGLEILMKRILRAFWPARKRGKYTDGGHESMARGQHPGALSGVLQSPLRIVLQSLSPQSQIMEQSQNIGPFGARITR